MTAVAQLMASHHLSFPLVYVVIYLMNAAPDSTIKHLLHLKPFIARFTTALFWWILLHDRSVVLDWQVWWERWDQWASMMSVGWMTFSQHSSSMLSLVYLSTSRDEQRCLGRPLTCCIFIELEYGHGGDISFETAYVVHPYKGYP